MELEFEIPFRELGFSGVPHRTASNVMPTVNCLVCARAPGHPAAACPAHGSASPCNTPPSPKCRSAMSTGVHGQCWACPSLGRRLGRRPSRVSSGLYWQVKRVISVARARCCERATKRPSVQGWGWIKGSHSNLAAARAGGAAGDAIHGDHDGRGQHRQPGARGLQPAQLRHDRRVQGARAAGRPRSKRPPGAAPCSPSSSCPGRPAEGAPCLEGCPSCLHDRWHTGQHACRGGGARVHVLGARCLSGSSSDCSWADACARHFIGALPCRT